MSSLKGQKLPLIQLLKSKDKMSKNGQYVLLVKGQNVFCPKDIMSFCQGQNVFCQKTLCPMSKDIMSFVQKTFCPSDKRTKGRNCFFFRRRASRQGHFDPPNLGGQNVLFLSQICPFFFSSESEGSVNLLSR